MADEIIIRVEVAYATPERQVIVAIDLPLDGTVEQAIQASGILQQFPEIDLNQQKVGVFGQSCKLNKPLTNGDRVEIYRALQQNPMDARRGRLQK
jgi:putative ubiquitin-RnfH superfamily antitoxin RatB of RatAB toxin-antitoxin module